MFSAYLDPTDWYLEISPERQTAAWQQSRVHSTEWAQWNAYLNQVCLDTCLAELRAYLPSPKTSSHREFAPFWELVNGSVITMNQTRFAIVPTEAIDQTELEVPQEWVDIPSWAADYYLMVQLAVDGKSLQILGYTTHQQLKTQGDYNAYDRCYCLAVDDLIVDLNLLWLSYSRYTSKQTKAVLSTIAPLPTSQANALIERLGRASELLPRLEIPFESWAALLETAEYRDRLYQHRTQASGAFVTRLNQWLQGQFDATWQAADRILSSQQPATATRSSNTSQSDQAPEPDVRRVKILTLEQGEIALIVNVSSLSQTEARISLQVLPTGESPYLPGETQLRLLSATGVEIGQAKAAVTETIQLQFRVNHQEAFRLEVSCNGQTFVEDFAV